MARIKGGLNAKKKHNRVLKMAKGSVSYTHLDVYKRQIDNGPMEGFWGI